MDGSFFDHSNFMPHGHCYLWKPEVLWLNLISDGLIALAYFAIPLVLLWLIRDNPRITAKWVIRMFSLFILFCGITHVISIITIWTPIYYIQGVVKAVTAAFSVVTAILFTPLAYNLLRGKSNGFESRKT